MIYCCHGLMIGWPIDQLAAWITGAGHPCRVVGGADPQPLAEEIEMEIQPTDTFIGHSKGAMLGFYLKRNLPLVITIDPTDWGSNINCPDWDLHPPCPGQWRATSGVKSWINFHQRSYPGGGVLSNPGPNRVDHYFPECDHLSIVNDSRTRKIILDALK